MGSEVQIKLPTGVPNTKICVLGGTNLATSLTRSEEIEGSFMVETEFGASPEVFYGSVEDVPFYHIVLHGGVGADKSRRDFRVNSLLRTWSALHLLGVTEVLGGATAGAINSKFRDGDWVIPDDFIDFNVDRPPSIVADILGAEADKIRTRYHAGWRAGGNRRYNSRLLRAKENGRLHLRTIKFEEKWRNLPSKKRPSYSASLEWTRVIPRSRSIGI